MESYQAYESADVLVVGGGTAGAVLARRDLAVGTRLRLLDSLVLSAADRANILGANASKLIPRFGSRHPTPGVDGAAR